VNCIERFKESQDVFAGYFPQGAGTKLKNDTAFGAMRKNPFGRYDLQREEITGKNLGEWEKYRRCGAEQF